VSESTGNTTAASLYSVDSNDPTSQLIDRSGMSREEVLQIGEVMGALGRLRDAEQRLSAASQRYMKLGRSDMRALHYLIVAEHQQEIVTPSAIASHLSISSASTTKLLDRLESGGHITREKHPSDRRALAIRVTEETRESATQTVGRLQAKRFHAAARLTPEERETVIHFLDDMTDQITIRSEAWANPDGASDSVESTSDDEA